jgi:hypothetical protein
MDWVHAVGCPDEKTVYINEEQSWRLEKYAEQQDRRISLWTGFSLSSLVPAGSILLQPNPAG